MNNKAKTLTIFLVTLSVLFLCVVLIITFLLREETAHRLAVEKSLSEVTAAKTDLEHQLSDTNKQLFLLQERMKESDLKIKSLLSDLDLAKSQQDVLSKENYDLKDALAKEQKEKAGLQQQLSQVANESTTLKEQIGSLEKAKVDAEKKAQAAVQSSEVPLGTIVVNPNAPAAPAEINVPAANASILTVNKEYQFVVTNLGEQGQVAPEQILSVTRDGKAIGELKVQRVQGNLSVADPVPPLKVDTLKEGDRVSVKK
jgi:hypothetical protein